MRTIEGKNDKIISKIRNAENTEKVTHPGIKTVYRIYDNETGKIKADLICLVGETFDETQDMLLFDPNEPWKKTTLSGGSYHMKELLVKVVENGRRCYTSPSVMEIRTICTQEKDTLWDENKRFINPAEIHVDLSQRLYDMKQELLSKHSN